MKLIIIYKDLFTTGKILSQLNEYVPAKQRRVEIELTKKQERAIKPRQVGSTNNINHYEDLASIFLEEPTS